MRKLHPLIFNSIFLLLASSFSIHGCCVPTEKHDSSVNTEADADSKIELINLINLIKDYNQHGKNLASILDACTRNQIKDNLDAEVTTYETDASNPEKSITLAETLFLVSRTKEDLAENKKIAKTLALKFHPDKTANKNLTNQQKTNNTQLHTAYIDLLLQNKKNARLENLYKKLTTFLYNDDLNDIVIPGSSLMKQLSTGVLILGLSSAAQKIGYDITKNMMSYKIEELKSFRKCIHAMYGNSLQIETQLIKFSKK